MEVSILRSGNYNLKLKKTSQGLRPELLRLLFFSESNLKSWVTNQEIFTGLKNDSY